MYLFVFVFFLYNYFAKLTNLVGFLGKHKLWKFWKTNQSIDKTKHVLSSYLTQDIGLS